MRRVLEAFGEPISFGGQESFVMGTIPHMDLDEFSFDLLTPYYCDNEGHRSWIESHGGEVYELGVEFNPGGDRRGIVEPVSRFLDAHRYDVVHIHSGSTSVLALMAKVAKGHGTPLVITHSHAPVEHFGPRNWLIREACSWDIERYADVLCAASKNAAEAKYAPRLQRRVRLIKNGIDLDEFTYKPEVRGRVREELGYPDDAYVIGHVGRFSHEKNQAFLVDVFDKVMETDEGARLLLVGGGETRGVVSRLVHERDLDEAVTFTGPTDRVSDLLQAMDAFAFPSRYESLGLGLVEAEASGLPAVVSDRVPAEAKVTNAYVRLPIDDTESVKRRWAEALLSFRGAERQGATREAEAAGFSVTDTANHLSALYGGAE